MTEPTPTVDVVSELDDVTRAEIGELADAAAETDGTNPLDDQVRLDLASGAAPTHRHLIARVPGSGTVVGYAHVDLRAPASASVHLVVHPSHRRAGVGEALLAQVVDVAQVAGHDTIRAWSHGDLPAAAAFAVKLDWKRGRELHQMRLAFGTPIEDPSYPAGVEVRTLIPGQDEQAWVEVNAEAFRDHAEQGRMTVPDLEQREQQAWFDPAGFFLAFRDGDLVGFHWTKVHPATGGRPALGEVYVVGVRPDAQGGGLGKALTLTGLHHLRRSGLDVILYVDGDNVPAVAVYTRLGFEIVQTDVMYERPRVPHASA